MSTYAYRQLKQQAQNLTDEERLLLIQDLIAISRHQGVLFANNASLPADLTPEKKLQLIEDFLAVLNQKDQAPARPRHSIKELRGLGKEIWEGIDAQEYVNQERDSWDG